MRISIAPASPKTGRSVVQALLALEDDSIHINALYRNLTKVPAEFTSRSNFIATQADVTDASTLDFSGSDVVLIITPPIYDGRDVIKHAELVSKNVRDAIEKAGSVRRIVLLTSVGAHLSEGVGEIKTNHIAEAIFATADVPEIIYVRCGYFMENWTADLSTLKQEKPHFFSTIVPLDWKIPMVAVKDIGHRLAAEITKPEIPSSKPQILELHGPQDYSPTDVQQAFSRALEREVQIKAVRKNELHAFFSTFLPPIVVDGWVEMSVAFLPGGVMAERPSNDEIVHGETGLNEAISVAVTEARA